jgi:hypothetical protein
MVNHNIISTYRLVHPAWDFPVQINHQLLWAHDLLACNCWNTAALTSTQLCSTELFSTQLNLTQFCSTQLCSTHLCSTHLCSTQLWSIIIYPYGKFSLNTNLNRWSIDQCSRSLLPLGSLKSFIKSRYMVRICLPLSTGTIVVAEPVLSANVVVLNS